MNNSKDALHTMQNGSILIREILHGMQECWKIRANDLNSMVADMNIM